SDRGRIARALEVARSTGRSVGAWRAERHGGIADDIALFPLILLPPRDWLYARCDARFDAMLEAGAITEVEALLACDLSPDLPVMRAIGVPEIAALIRGELSREQATEAAKQATRRYAKRQYTWFSRQPPVDWPRTDTTSNKDLINEFAIKLRQ
ncbi:MAG: tRNA (adenosine(37)-N6)-dimethylallyltransferase MiaA, partial [Sphingomonadaceae bacterium]|nr:tRNA (adenosine(37)-N6)-dimethylallyltransferase MiaA [Sphingomonadaceae bacterium]